MISFACLYANAAEERGYERLQLHHDTCARENMPKGINCVCDCHESHAPIIQAQIDLEIDMRTLKSRTAIQMEFLRKVKEARDQQ